MLKPDPRYGRTFIRDWRKHRNLTIERLADRLTLTAASLSRIERGLQPYSQPILEALADALRCSPADLLMRNPSQDQMVWSLWDQLDPTQKQRARGFIEALATEKAA